jgi:hypothetical protein
MAASLSFQATDTDNGTIGSGASHTFTLTVASAAGQERLIAVGGIGGFSPAADYVSLTCDGQAATRVGTVARGANDGTNVCSFVTFYRAPGTSGTSINVVATNAANFSSIYGGVCAVWTLSGADTLLATTNAATNDPTLNTNTATGGTAAAVLLGYNGSGLATAWSGLTENFDSIGIFGNDLFSGASADIASGSTPLAISANITPDLSASIASCCVSFSPLASGGRVVPINNPIVGGFLINNPSVVG